MFINYEHENEIYNVSVERRKILKAFGADIMLTDPSKGTDGAIEKKYNFKLFDFFKDSIIFSLNENLTYRHQVESLIKKIPTPGGLL